MSTTDTQDTSLAQTMDNLPVHAPLVDIYEDTGRLLFVADMPGVEETAVDVRMDKGELTLEGRRQKRFHADSSEAFVYRRTFVLPKGIVVDDITAKFAEGVLSVEVPKTNVVASREIPVNLG